MILYGAPVRERIKEDLKNKIKALGRAPSLCIIQVGNREDSTIYIKNKIKFGEEIGAKTILKILPSDIDEGVVLEKIRDLNQDDSIDGIIIQLPLPQNLDSNKIISEINENKDADGLKGVKEKNELLVTPATARAVIFLIDFYKIEVKGKKATVLGRSRLAGGPIAKSLEKMEAVVSVCGRDTLNIKEISESSDILVSATGTVNLVDKNFVKSGQTVIDVGINRVNIDGKIKIVGDVVFDEVSKIVENISPVPGGVGPLTVASLFENLLDLCYYKSRIIN